MVANHPSSTKRQLSHSLQFYEQESFLVRNVVEWIHSGLNDSAGILVVTSPARIDAMERRLFEESSLVDSAKANGQLVFLRSDEIIGQIFVDGMLAPDRFRDGVGRYVSALTVRYPTVKVYGDMVDTLSESGNFTAVIQLEEEWNELRKIYPLDLLCGYSMHPFSRSRHQEVFDTICNLHQYVEPAESVCGQSDKNAVFREIARLQQRAAALEAEVEDRKRSEKRVAEQAMELARSHEELLRITYIASHDLKEPLRAVVSFLQLLERKYTAALDEQAREYIGFAIRGAFRMKHLVEGIVDHARTSMSKMASVPTHCNSAFDEAVANLQGVIKSAGAIVSRSELPTVNLDPIHMIQIFQNLIHNAVKFQDSHSAVVEVGAIIDNPREWRFFVKDNGIGIQPDYFDTIFNLFQKLHVDSRYPGSGIGLATCKKIIESWGGRIWVESEPGAGSTFWFTIPA